MKSVGVILGVCVLFLGVAMLSQRSKDLSPNPQMDQAVKLEKEQQKAAAKYDKEVVAQKTRDAKPWNPPKQGMLTAVLSIEGRGDVAIELYPQAAPKTVAHFKSLLDKGFYKGVKFHRVVDGFVVQAGDPKTKDVTSQVLAGMTEQEKQSQKLGAGGSGETVPFEVNDLAHYSGAVAMALNTPQSATGDSQFYICLADNHRLNTDYCVFGKVVQGMDVVAKITQGDAIRSFAIK